MALHVDSLDALSTLVNGKEKTKAPRRPLKQPSGSPILSSSTVQVSANANAHAAMNASAAASFAPAAASSNASNSGTGSTPSRAGRESGFSRAAAQNVIGAYKPEPAPGAGSFESASGGGGAKRAAAPRQPSVGSSAQFVSKGAAVTALPSIGSGGGGGGGAAAAAGGGSGLKRLDDLNNPSNWGKLFNTDRTGMGLDDDDDDGSGKDSDISQNSNKNQHNTAAGHTPPLSNSRIAGGSAAAAAASGGSASGRPQSRARPARAGAGGMADETPDPTLAFVNSTPNKQMSSARHPTHGSFGASASSHTSQPVSSGVISSFASSPVSVSFASTAVEAPSVFSPDFGTRSASGSVNSTPAKSAIKAPQNTPAKSPAASAAAASVSSVAGGSVSFDLSPAEVPPAAAGSGGGGYVPSTGSGGRPNGGSAGGAAGGAGGAGRQPVSFTCPDCKRRFSRAPFLKHRKICQNVFGDAKKRAVFDSKQARLKDLGIDAVRADEDAELAAAAGTGVADGDDDDAATGGTPTAAAATATAAAGTGVGAKSNSAAAGGGAGGAGGAAVSGTDWKKQSTTLRDMIKAGKKKKEHHNTAVKAGIDIGRMS